MEEQAEAAVTVAGSSPTPQADEIEYAKLKIPELKALCKARKLKVGGTKPELIARLKGLPPPPPKPKAPKKVKVVPKPSDDGPEESTSASAGQPASVPTSVIDVSAEQSQIPNNSINISATEAALAAIPSHAQIQRPDLSTSRQPSAAKAKKKATHAALAKFKPLLLSRLNRKSDISPALPVSTSANASVVLPMPTVRISPAKATSRVGYTPKVPVFAVSRATQRSPGAHEVQKQPLVHDYLADYTWIDRCVQKAYESARQVLLLSVHDLPVLPAILDPSLFKIACRFYIYRMIVMLASDAVLDASLNIFTMNVVSVDLVHPSIAKLTLSTNNFVYAIALTGECIGSSDAEVFCGAQALRSDWARFAQAHDSILDRVHTEDDEQYHHGIAKAFSSRSSGSSSLTIAQTFVLAQSSPRAISGSYQSVAEQHFGSSTITSAQNNRDRSAALYLPSSLAVECISCPADMHPALCEVQTVSKMFYALRLTGQIVGNEEDCLSEIWQSFFECDARGRLPGHSKRVMLDQA